MAANPDIHFSACPHDCPSTCALEVEKLDEHHIGKVRGARDNTYTVGVVCSKVARYAERVHATEHRLLVESIATVLARADTIGGRR